MNGLEVFTCGAGNNFGAWCNKRFDAAVARARPVQNADIRYRLYGGLEQAMFGPNGDMPIIPLYWGANVSLVSDRIRDTFRINPQALVHFDEIRVKQ
jgi:ABC-type oligopeptide transport system substrate-binding subunit